MWNDVGQHLAWHLLITIVVVLCYDMIALAFADGRATVSALIRLSWMSAPVAITVGLLVGLHFWR